MIHPSKRIFTLHYKNTAKAITIKPHLDIPKTLEQLKSRFGIPYNHIIIGLLERDHEKDFLRLEDFLNSYSTIESERFTILIKEVSIGRNIRLIEYSEEIHNIQDDNTPVVILNIESIERLKKLRLFFNPYAVYFYRLCDNECFHFYYKDDRNHNVNILILNDLLYNNQPFDFSLDDFDKMFGALETFIDLIGDKMSQESLKEIVENLFYKKTFLILLVQSLRYYYKGLYSYQELIINTEAFIKQHFNYRMNLVIRKINTYKKELKSVSLPFNHEEKPQNNKITKNYVTKFNNTEKVWSATTKHNQRTHSDPHYDNKNIKAQKNENKSENDEIYNKLNAIDREISVDIVEEYDSPSTSPGDIQLSKMKSVTNNRHKKQSDINPVITNKSDTIVYNSSPVIQEESENDEVDVYNIYDTVTISDSESDAVKKIEKKRTNTADFEPHDTNQQININESQSLYLKPDTDIVKDSKPSSISLQKPKLLSDQNMLGIDQHFPTESSELKVTQKSDTRTIKESKVSNNKTEVVSSTVNGNNNVIRKKSYSLKETHPNHDNVPGRKRAATEKRFSFKPVEGKERPLAEEPLNVHAFINDDMRFYETLLIEVVINLQPNDIQKKLIWQLFHNRNDNLKYALGYYKKYQSMSLLLNVLNHYMALVDVNKQKSMEAIYLQKTLSLESCRYLLNQLVSQKQISIRTENLILTYILQGSLIVLSTFELYLKINDQKDFIENLKLIEDITLRNFSDKYVNLKSALIFKPKDINYLAEQQPWILNAFKSSFSPLEYDTLKDLFSQNSLYLYEQYNKYLKNLDQNIFIENLKIVAANKKQIDAQTQADNIHIKSSNEIYLDRKRKINLIEKFVCKSKQKLNKEFLLSKTLENDLVLSGISEFSQHSDNDSDILENIELYFKLTFFERKYKKVNEVIEKTDLTQTQIRFLQDTIKSENEPFLMAAIKLYEQNLKEDQFIEQVKVILNQKNVV